MSEPPRPVKIAVAADATPDLSSASIVVGGYIDDQRILVERGVAVQPDGTLFPDHRAGLAWVVPRLKELKQRHRVAAIIIDPVSPAAALLVEAGQAGLDVITPNARDIGQAFGQFLNWVVDGKIVHLGDQNPDLRAAVAGAARRDIGDGQYAWSRKSTTVDISPLCAATLAAWGAHKFARRRDLSKTVAGPTLPQGDAPWQ